MKVEAGDLLIEAAHHMNDRAVTYDQPSGERSMGATVSAFNAITGHRLSEEQGWLFMETLKMVRSQQGAYRPDNYTDAVAYAALRGEAAAWDRPVDSGDDDNWSSIKSHIHHEIFNEGEATGPSDHDLRVSVEINPKKSTAFTSIKPILHAWAKDNALPSWAHWVEQTMNGWVRVWSGNGLKYKVLDETPILHPKAGIFLINSVLRNDESAIPERHHENAAIYDVDRLAYAEPHTIWKFMNDNYDKWQTCGQAPSWHPASSYCRDPAAGDPIVAARHAMRRVGDESILPLDETPS